MPAVVPRVLSRNTLPGETRRQVWSRPEVISHALVLLTANGLHLVSASQSFAPELIKELDGGADPEKRLSGDPLVIPLSSIMAVTLDLPLNALQIDYGPAPTNANSISVGLANAELADLLFEVLWWRLGPTVELQPFSEPWQSLVRTPLMVMGVVLTVTLTFALVMNAMEDGSSPLRSIGAPSWLDWRLICGLGGGILALTQIWTYRRITRPTTRLRLVRISAS
jgi:hypothetical protein